MSEAAKPSAVIMGVGDGLSAALARRLAPDYALHLCARSPGRMNAVAEETGAATHLLDGTDPGATRVLFEALDPAPRVAIYNPSARVKGPITDLDPEEVRKAVEVTAFGAFLMAQAAARRMLAAEPDERGVRGTILFTGASAGVKGFPRSSVFAMGKFAQRGLAESLSRELHPQGVHVAWINIDGAIRNPGREEPEDNPDSMLDPGAIAEAYATLILQDRSAWSHELTLRPWVEDF
ncbi:SDR family NAD(P)-dependent oxidoreductase [Roseivivax sediminis]|uniref:NADP-dependent 3-hydroxy acid dehydrogenase YdfG n=1 Tax=Roseivivax sediminis TaxID=936889 RepID=A0A1I1TC20_9RHOB|nr:SDR family NAD(P)-dependent oxidoreductase [Roseivivax sediminis]SFD53010.1 NADP-dependent 3-hydroxy acid dehydrogenase YdfG [Roseivivax sediminis]